MKIKKIALGTLMLFAIGFAGYDIGTFIVDYTVKMQQIQDNCPIHNRVETNPPILLNTTEGTTVEMKIFDSYSDTISDKKDYGYMNMGSSEGVFLMAFPDESYADISINKDLQDFSKRKAKKHLCSKCLEAIDKINPTTNYVVVDCYDRNNLKYYNLKDIEEQEIQIRHYTLQFDKDMKEYKFKIESNYFEGGKTLDYEKETKDIGHYYIDSEKGTVYLA